MKVTVVWLMGPSNAPLMVATESEWEREWRLVLLTCKICWPTLKPCPDRAAEPSGWGEQNSYSILVQRGL